jgi:hypothetical protein
MMYKSIYTVLITCIFSYVLNAQDINVFSTSEDSLKKIAVNILYGESDSMRYSAYRTFSDMLSNTLHIENSFSYPFDSLTSIARLTSPDEKFRLFNWNLPKDDGTYEYFSIIQMNSKSGKDYRLIKLSDGSASIKKPETAVLDQNNWFGALYYRMIEKKYRHKTYYALLGWDGNDRYTRKKIIEVLTFDKEMAPVFGERIFKGKDYSQNTRIIFEYSATAALSLKYEKHIYQKVKHFGKHSWTKRRHSYMIVFDHLVPLDQSLEGVSRYLVPSGSIFDAFVFRKGCWNFTGDVDARNPNYSKKPGH